mmetsp:Transcript_6149/g.16715  ORF Transcript_6149/g.16715 Transcript_6149/m.16715 type:complete len:145 (-) Transcript_6149:655-1089(-)
MSYCQHRGLQLLQCCWRPATLQPAHIQKHAFLRQHHEHRFLQLRRPPAQVPQQRLEEGDDPSDPAECLSSCIALLSSCVQPPKVRRRPMSACEPRWTHFPWGQAVRFGWRTNRSPRAGWRLVIPWGQKWQAVDPLHMAKDLRLS